MLATLILQVASPPTASADPFKLGVQDNNSVPSQAQYAYPAPAMVAPIQRPPMQGNVNASPPMQGQIQQPRMAPQPPPRPPIQARVQQQVALPQGYMGVWHVSGRLKGIDASPEFQAAAQQAFAPSTDNVWQISGSAGSYQMGNGQMSCQLFVDRVGPDGTAFIRYQHQVGKTMAQEAIVMSLAPGGAQFSGLERISIVKDGGPPRAKVTYELMGQRQR